MLKETLNVSSFSKELIVFPTRAQPRESENKRKDEKKGFFAFNAAVKRWIRKGSRGG